jgi:hypothetical protein
MDQLLYCVLRTPPKVSIVLPCSAQTSHLTSAADCTSRSPCSMPTSRTSLPRSRTAQTQTPTAWWAPGQWLYVPEGRPPQLCCAHDTDAYCTVEERGLLKCAHQSLASTPNYVACHAPLQAALFSLAGSGFAQRGASGAFSDINSASCNNFVWLRSGSAADADAEDPRLAASCFLKGPGHTVVSRLACLGCQRNSLQLGRTPPCSVRSQPCAVKIGRECWIALNVGGAGLMLHIAHAGRPRQRESRRPPRLRPRECDGALRLSRHCHRPWHHIALHFDGGAEVLETCHCE